MFTSTAFVWPLWDDTYPEKEIEPGVFFHLHVWGQFTQPLQSRIAEGVQFRMRNGFNLAEGLAQHGEMSQAIDTADPNHPRTAFVPQLLEPSQIG